MEEVQSWWEVPAVAHFCYVFREAFNLFYYEIAELESVILNVQDPEMSTSLEQLVTRLLQGCYNEKDVTAENWEEKLHNIFCEKCGKSDNPLEDSPFSFLPPRSKVEVLYKLCEFRLDADGAFEDIKDISANDMQACCVGKDSQSNTYWHFYDERLYKEDPSALAANSKKSVSSGKGKNAKNNTVAKNGRRTPVREKKSKENVNKPWSIVCHNSSEWEAIRKKFSKSKHSDEKELAKEIENKYLPLLVEIVAEKDRLLRKRFLELAPKRTSSRLSKLQAQSKLKEQMEEEAAEAKRKMREDDLAKKEAERKKKEIEGRARRAEERQKILEGRSLRAQQRELARGNLHCSDSSSEDSDTTTDRRNSRRSNRTQNVSDVDCEESESSSDSESENEQHSSKADSSDDQSVDSDEESQNISRARKMRASVLNGGSSVSQNRFNERNFSSLKSVRSSRDLSEWNAEVDSKGHKIHILHCPPFNEKTKRFKPNEGNYKSGPINTLQTKDLKSTDYKENRTYQFFQSKNLKTYSNVTSSPSIIRIDFIKPPTMHQISR